MVEWGKTEPFYIAVFQEMRCMEGAIHYGDRHKCSFKIVAG